MSIGDRVGCAEHMSGMTWKLVQGEIEESRMTHAGMTHFVRLDDGRLIHVNEKNLGLCP